MQTVIRKVRRIVPSYTLILGHVRTYSEVLDCIPFLRNRRIRQNHST